MENPLISIVVITYNSAKFIIETLDSIYNQTYNNIELIITDDCSKDNTIEICEQWLLTHKERFFKTQIIVSRINTGIPANCNRGYNASSGEWIKAIAGDDLLISSCIEANVKYVLNNPRTELLFSKIKPLGDNEIINKNNNLFCYGALDLKQTELLYLLLLKNVLPASTLFIKKETFKKLGGYEESIPLLEDWPFWIKASYHKIKFSFNNQTTVIYRMTESSISLSTNPSPLYLLSHEIFFNNYLNNYQKKANKLLWIYYKCKKNINQKKGFIKLLYILSIYINPINYYIYYIENKAMKCNYKYINSSN